MVMRGKLQLFNKQDNKWAARWEDEEQDKFDDMMEWICVGVVILCLILYGIFGG